MFLFSNKCYPVRVHISTLFILLVLLSSGTVSILYYLKSIEMTDAQTDALLSRLVHGAILELGRQGDLPAVAVNLTGQHQLIRAENLEQRLESLDFLKQFLATGRELTSIYVGYANGDFFLFRTLRDEKDRVRLKAPEDCVWVVQSIERNQGSGIVEKDLFFNAFLQQIATMERDTAYDPRQRAWYQRALSSDTMIRTKPYLFYTYGKIGITFARAFDGGQAVVGTDIRMETLSALLQEHSFTPGSHIILFNKEKDILAYHQKESDFISKLAKKENNLQPKVDELGVPVLNLLTRKWQEQFFSGTGRVIIESDDIQWVSSVIPMEGKRGDDLYLGIAVPYHELMAKVIAVRNKATITVIVFVACLIPLALIIAKIFARPIRALGREAEAASRFDFLEKEKVSSNIKEVEELARAVSFMKKTISEFLALVESINKEKNFTTLLEKIGNESRQAAGAEGVCIYLLNEEKQLLEPGVYCDAQQCLEQIPLPELSLEEDNYLTASMREGKVFKFELGNEELPEVVDLLQAADNQVTIWCLPLKNRQDTPTGLICLFFISQQYGIQVTSLDERIAYVQKMSGLAGITLETRELIQKQKELFNAFIKLIAGAIDAKSPYTGGHCQRVPVIANMLAQAACEEKTGPFTDFQLDDEQWEELHVASWLHDCGKVTTPEFIVDKATKLETIYDRIHEVRMRFELLKKEAELKAWKAIAEGAASDESLASYNRIAQELDEEFSFVAHCNQGGEFLSTESVDRLRQIASRTWTRTMSDRQGVSWEEGKRKERTEEQPLPTQEKTLSDKEEHLITRSAVDHLPEDNPWGFKLEEPEHLYNRGELHNLSVSRGTLSEEERFKINDHIVQTIKMLNELPYPKHLKNVPEIAGGHHETTKGTGYPRKLTADQMSIPAKMMVIADVFEALTASDRPYKKAKKMSEALKIMSFMHKDGHFDDELYRLFLESGVYRKYGEQYLEPYQIDEVNISDYM